jgi:hypothetical protein
MDEMMIEFGLPKMKIVSTSENKKNRKMVIDEWQLGPENPSIERTANKEYWEGSGQGSGRMMRKRLAAECAQTVSILRINL